MRRTLCAVMISALSSGCVTTEGRGSLLSTAPAKARCTDEYSGAIEPAGAPTVHLRVTAHSTCAPVETQTWTTVTSSRLTSTPRAVIAIIATVAMLGAYVGILAASTGHDRPGPHQDQMNAATATGYEVVGGAALGAVGFGIYALLGVAATSSGVETFDVLVPNGETRHSTHPVEGTLQLSSGKSLPLTGSGLDVDVNELGGPASIDGSPVDIEGSPSVSSLTKAVPDCWAVNGVDPLKATPEQLASASRCTHAGWLLDSGWSGSR